MPKESREIVNVTAALKNILDNYPAGSASLREILQNTDDAGAKNQTFILDTRTFGTNSLVDPVLSVCQGPAILATNDGYFKPKDWLAIKTILDSSKKQDEASTGKYGLGFRSCYHITDNPHILSNDQLHIFDPHQRTQKYAGGFELSTLRLPDAEGGIDREAYEDHFSTFSSVFKPKDDVYKGTAIRLPLRLPGFKSELKSTPTTVADARQKFKDFIAKELPEAMLFLKNITEIIFKEIDGNGDEIILATAKMENPNASASQRTGLHARYSQTSHDLVTVTIQIGSDDPRTSSWILTHYVEKYETSSAHLAERLKRPQDEVEADMATDKLLPRVALAFPLPQPGVADAPKLNGHLFTLLPLPIVTNFPLHINAVLALVSDRQHLRNAHDVTEGSREELLVEWNRVVFSELVPKAWASLLDHLVSLSRPDSSGISYPSINTLEAWPNPVATQDGDQGYWYPAPARLLEEAGPKAVWPLHGKSSQFSTLNDVLVVMEGDSAALLAPLEECDVPLVVVPEGVFRLIEKSEFKKAILSPETSYPYLKQNSRLISDLDAAAKRLICDYLVSAKNIRLILDLPIIPQIQKNHAAITSHGKYIIATKSEALALGNADPNLLAAKSMSAATRQLLLSDPSGRVRSVDHTDVVSYLEDQVPTGTTLANITTGVSQATFDWLVKFWSWLDGWEKRDELFNNSPSWSGMQTLHALPIRLSGGRLALRQIGKSAIRPTKLDPNIIAALTALDVPVLEASISNGSAVQHVSRAPNDVVFILQSLQKKHSFYQLPQQTRQTLHDFFTQQLSDHLRFNPRTRSRTTLNEECRTTLRRLPIFPVITPGLRDSNSFTFDACPEGACFVDNSVRVIPNIRDAPFISHDQGKILHTALEEQETLGEIAVLRKSIDPDAWFQQDRVAGLLSALVERLIKRLNELGDSSRSILAELPFVEVGGRAGRHSPSQVVDPASDLAGLYSAEDEVIPIGQFATEGPGSYISQLRNHGMVRSALTPSVIMERIARISDLSRPMQERSKKALRLLHLLDSYARSEKNRLPTEVVDIICASAWLPVADKFRKPSECWDSRRKDALLCDLVLPRISIAVSNQYLRDCLGWTRIRFRTLQSQILKVVETEPKELNLSEAEAVDRIEAVLKELASELHAGRVSQGQIESILDALGDSAWVPYSSRKRCVGRRSMLEQIDLGAKYHAVSASLLRVAGMESLLVKMGIPSREISKELLQADVAKSARDVLVRTSISILEELCRSIEGKESEFRRTLVPTDDCRLAPAPEVLYNDMGGDPTGPLPGFQFAHPLISSGLASTLGLRRLSEEAFSSEGDGIQSFHMEEDLTVRIRKVLQDYDIDHSSNEWVANADDAGASSVTFLIDEASFEGRRVIGGLNDFQSGPALVVHNDGVFTEADFKGLGNIGQGGKAGRADAIGRFGLGALSFYHFSELPLIISGKYCLFLDPSKQYLPRENGNIKRSAALVPLSLCISRYPDQLKPLDGLFDFSSKQEEYKGTIFRFPLRTETQAKDSNLSKKYFGAVDIAGIINQFYGYASQSLFFTKSITEIAAIRRSPNLESSPVWFVTSSRKPMPHGAKDVVATRLSLTIKGPNSSDTTSEQWLVTRSQASKEGLPPHLQPLFSLHRLPTPTVGLAVHLSAKSVIRHSRLFATLPLPVSISLPVHVHGTWILAQDRRSIRYDAPDATGQRPLDTQYNEHLLETAIAPLYIKTLGLVLAHHPKEIRLFWPDKVQSGPSRVIATKLYKQIITTTEPILLSVQNKPIAPSNAVIQLPGTPPAVRRILYEIKVPNYVQTPYFNTGFLEDWGSLRFVSPKEVSKILRDHATAVQYLWQSANSTSPSFSVKADLLPILDYLIKEKQSLVGIPLLLRGDGKLVEFQNGGEFKIFASHKVNLAKLFGQSVVLSSEISEAFADNLVKQNLNVVPLNPQGMRDLLAQHSEVVTSADTKAATSSLYNWHKDLLKFLILPTCPVRVEDLADLPLLPVVGREMVVSLNFARTGGIWWRSLSENRALTNVLLRLDVISVDDLPGELQRTATNDLERILQLFERLKLSPEEILRRVASEDWAPFVAYLKAWITPYYLATLSAADFQTLNKLPIFEGRQGTRSLSFVPANQVTMLPDSVPLEAVARYLPSESTFAAASPELNAILRRGKNANRNLTLPALFKRLRLPSHLAPHEEVSFLSLVELIAMNHTGNYDTEIIPDGNRTLRRPSELFDHRVTVFLTAFENRPHLFIHPNFRHLIDRLVYLGVNRDVTSQRLVECIRAVDHDAREGQQVVNRAASLWEYVNSAPQELRQIPFDTIRGLRFLPRHTQRHPSDSDFDTHARELPDVVSLDDLCAPEREVIAWTQRARFTASPSPHLKAVYPNIGEPTAVNVVQHLVTLVNHVAPNRPQSSVLLIDIRSVYTWLQNHKDTVRELLRSRSEQPLWLNIDSVQDFWTLRSSDELVFDITHNAGGRFMVRNFLIPYRPLLLEVGAHEYRVATLPPQRASKTKIPHPEMMRFGWNKLRQTGQLLDICFKVQGQEIQAHRGMLAAMVPHFNTAFSGSFRESVVMTEDAELPVYPLPEDEAASAFAVQCVVDYVYTGTLAHPTFSENDIEEATAVLDDLLDLVELSNLWDVPELTTQAVLAIVELGLIRFDTCDDVLARAEACQVELLIEICQRTKQQNKWM